MNIPLLDLKAQHEEIKEEINEAVQRVLNSGWFVLGKECEAFEQEFAEYNGSKHAIGVGSGTEALHLALLALNVGKGDEVITVPNTAIPTISAISLTGATPVFVDIDPESYTMDPRNLEERITARTKAIIPIHLFGQAADMDSILEIASKHHIPVIEDCAQAHGATYRGKKTGNFGVMGCFSFYPSKNLGAYGDAGLITTSDEKLKEKLLMLRNYGQKGRYIHAEKGTNSRLDEIQATILRVKLKHLDRWNERRRELANIYTRELRNVVTPKEMDYANHVYHLYVIRTPNRDQLMHYLKEHGVGTQIHYPIPAHMQEAYQDLEIKEGTLPISESHSKQIVSLPLYPELKDEMVLTITKLINEFSPL
jgi:dTDP-4-amino-4,6-dideoxygalactose transaminase